MSEALNKLINSVNNNEMPTLYSFTESEREELSIVFLPRDRTFSEEERALLNQYCILISGQENISIIEQFNDLSLAHKAPILTNTNNDKVLSIDLISWCDGADGFSQIKDLMCNSPIILFAPMQQDPNSFEF